MARNFMCTKTDPVVETKAGKLRGFQLDGTYAFHGVKYADAKRFHQPTPVEPWEGIKNALAYGYVCPMLQQDQPSNELMVPHRYWPLDENCQYLNIWTQHLDPNAKKPVLVWLHGGGFAAGSSIEHIAYEGGNMSKYGDVVVISLNHRLNILAISTFPRSARNIRIPATPATPIWSQLCSGFTKISQTSAATRKTSRCSASPAAV